MEHRWANLIDPDGRYRDVCLTCGAVWTDRCDQMYKFSYPAPRRGRCPGVVIPAHEVKKPAEREEYLRLLPHTD